jgi:hypothetical protein
MLDSPVVAEAAPRAPDAVAAARALQAEAEAEWEGGDLGRCVALSRLAQVQVRLGVALARQGLARDRRAEAEQTLAEAEAAYREIEARRQVLEQRLARLWAHREAAQAIAREQARAVEEEALRAERLPEAERTVWERTWRAKARADAADAERTLLAALLLGAETAYPEAARMARDAVDTAVDAAGTSPWRIERPLVDYARMQGDELRFRMLSLDEDGGPEAHAARIAAMVDAWRTGFDPPFHVALDPRGVLLSLEAKGAEIEISFPEPIARALRDLRTKWTSDPDLRCVVSVRSLDPDCGDGCDSRMETLADRFVAEIAGDAADRARAQGVGFTVEEPPTPGLSREGSVRVDVLVFPAVRVPESATPGHTEGVAAGSQE